MARIKYPARFIDWIELFKNIKKKHDDDGSASALIPFLTEEAINIDDDELKVDAANDLHKAFLLLEKGAEDLSQQRDNLFTLVWDYFTDGVQYLKKLYRKSVNRLGEWSITVDNRNRIVYPPDFLERKQLVIDFLDKHDSYTPPASPLQPFLDANSIDVTGMRTDAGNAETFHNDFNDLNRQKEEQRAERDLKMDDIKDHIRGIGQYLVGLKPNNPNHAGKWGFTVDNSPQADKTRDYSLAPGEVKTVKNVVLKTKVKNIGSSILHIHPGIDTNSTPVVINPEQEFTVVRGFGKMTIVNESNSVKGGFEATFNT